MDDVKIRVIDSDKLINALVNAINEGSYDVNLSAVMALGATLLDTKKQESTRTFVELVVEYLDPEVCPYKEYKGKPYYSIKYIENGETHIGYGTYNPEVLSQYLKEFFISSEQSEKGEWLRMSDLSEKDDDRYKCSRCGNVIHHKSRMDLYTFNGWCGRCGSDNRRHTTIIKAEGEG